MMSYLTGATSGFNRYAAGDKRYGGGRSNPTMGPVDKLGYAERDRVAASRRNAILARLKAGQQGRLMSVEYGRQV